MKKLIALVLTLVLALGASLACAEQKENVFDSFRNVYWMFASGAGGWSSEMSIEPDGTFAGEYHDSEIGETGENYPDGTLYLCAYTGKMSVVEKVNDYTWKIRVDELKPNPVQESIVEGIRYMPTEPYGLTEGDEMLLYAPGTPVSTFAEEVLLWTHVNELETVPAELPEWFLYSEKNDSGFVGETMTGMANPWQDLTAEELKAASNLIFGVPEDAKEVIYRYLPEQGLAEMQFKWEDAELCARIQAASAEEGPNLDISGMYFNWENVEDVTVGNCKGTIGSAQTGTSEYVQLCQWYDAENGLKFSLSIYTTDLDGLDLTALAEQVYAPYAAK